MIKVFCEKNMKNNEKHSVYTYKDLYEALDNLNRDLVIEIMHSSILPQGLRKITETICDAEMVCYLLSKGKKLDTESIKNILMHDNGLDIINQIRENGYTPNNNWIDGAISAEEYDLARDFLGAIEKPNYQNIEHALKIGMFDLALQYIEDGVPISKYSVNNVLQLAIKCSADEAVIKAIISKH